MRLLLALAALGSVFSAPARAELVQATLTGHITYLATSHSRSGWVQTPSALGFSMGQTAYGLLRYDTSFNPSNDPRVILTAEPAGYGLSLIANGSHLNSTGNVRAATVPLDPSLPPGWGDRVPAGLYVSNWLKDPLHPSLSLLTDLVALDPKGQLLGASATTGTNFPSPAALASYSPQGNAIIHLLAFDSQMSVDLGISVNSITVSHAPEPSSLLLFGLGGLGLASYGWRGRRQSETA